jgi:hypothetical protein
MASTSIPFKTTETSSQCPLASTWDSVAPTAISSAGFLASKFPKFGHNGSAEYIRWAKKKIGKIDVSRRISNGISVFGPVINSLVIINHNSIGPQVWIAGGYANALLDPIMHSEKQMKSRKLGVNYSPPSDIDMYIVGGDEQARLAQLGGILTYFQWRKSFCVKSRFAVTISLSASDRAMWGVESVQIVLVSTDSIDKILSDYDIDCCAVAVTIDRAEKSSRWEIKAVALPRAIAAMKSRVNVYNPALLTWSYAKRICKYISRGYDFYVPPEYEVEHLLKLPFLVDTQNTFLLMLFKGPFCNEMRGPSACYCKEEEMVASNELLACTSYKAAKILYDKNHDHYKYPITLSESVDEIMKDVKFEFSPEAMTEEASKGVPSDQWPSLRSEKKEKEKEKEVTVN